MGLFPVLQLRLLGLFLMGLFPVGTLSCFAFQTAGTHSVGNLSVGTLSCFPTQTAGTLSVGTLSAGTLSVLTASVGTLSCWDSFRSDSFHHPTTFAWRVRLFLSIELPPGIKSGELNDTAGPIIRSFRDVTGRFFPLGVIFGYAFLFVVRSRQKRL